LVNPGNAEPPSPESLHIGVLACLTGPCADVGTNSVRGLQLAQKRINDGGGIAGRQVEFVVEDTAEGESPRSAVPAFRRLLANQDIRFVIGPTWSIGGMALAPLMKSRQDMLFLTPSVGIADFNRTAKNIFNLWPHDAQSSQILARYAVNEGMKKASVLNAQNDWSMAQARIFIAEFEANGGKVLAHDEPLSGQSDLRTEITRALAKQPDVVFLSHFNHLGSAAKQLRLLGFRGVILLPQLDKERLDSADGALEGAIFAGHPPADAVFAQEYSTDYGLAPGLSSDKAYDALFVLKYAIEDATNPTEIDSIIEALLRTNYHGVSGDITFDSDGGVQRKPLIHKVEDNQIVLNPAE